MFVLHIFFDGFCSFLDVCGCGLWWFGYELGLSAGGFQSICCCFCSRVFMTYFTWDCTWDFIWGVFDTCARLYLRFYFFCEIVYLYIYIYNIHIIYYLYNIDIYIYIYIIYIILYILYFLYIILYIYIACDFTWDYQCCCWIYDWFVYVLLLFWFLQNIAKHHR